MNVSVVTYFEIILNGVVIATADDEQEARDACPENASVFAASKTVIDQDDEIHVVINKTKLK